MKRISYLDMVKGLLSEEEVLEFEQWYRRPVQKSLKPIFSRMDFSSFEEALKKEGWVLKPPKFSFKGKVYDDVLFVEKQDGKSLGSHPLHQQGVFYVQEMAAGMAAQVLMRNSEGDDVILDMCAAPGGKSIQLADCLQRRGGLNSSLDSSFRHGVLRDSTQNDMSVGVVIANEVNPSRRRALKANLERCGMWNVIVTGYDGRQLGDLLYEQCDKVLVDAPCSGEGMQYKSDFKVYGRNERQAKKLAHTQYELLMAGFKALKVGGEMVYSTCTTNVIENEGVVAKVLEMLGERVELVDVEIEEKSEGVWMGKVARFWPHIHHTGGFFIAKFKKIWSCAKGEDFLASRACHQRRVLADEEVQQHISQPLPSDMALLQSKHTVRAVSRRAIWFLDVLYVDRVWLPVFKVLGDGEWKPLEGWGKVFGLLSLRGGAKDTTKQSSGC